VLRPSFESSNIKKEVPKRGEEKNVKNNDPRCDIACSSTTRSFNLRAEPSAMMSPAAAAAMALLTVTLLLLEAPGGALAQDAPGRGGNKNKNNLDRCILLEWRATSPPLQRVWRDEGAPVSAWKGVTVNADGRVVKIRLERKDLTGGVPAALARLSALNGLVLGYNRLTSVPMQLGNLIALRQLRLSDNQLASVPAELGNLSALTTLSLDDNQLTSVPK
jgi:Leucine-rich repeat (LRR) protein